MTTRKQRAIEKRLQEIIRRSENNLSIAQGLLPNKLNEKPFDINQPLSNANLKSGYMEDPVYEKLVDEVRFVEIRGQKGVETREDEINWARLKSTCFRYADLIKERQMDERTYTFLLKNSPEAIVNRFMYNDWRI